MKALVSYRSTGADMVELEALLVVVCEGLMARGVDPYCIFFEKARRALKQLAPEEMMQTAFERIDSADFLFVVQASEARSEGMLMEVGYAVARNVPVVVATHSDVQATYLPQMAHETLDYTTLQDLKRKIRMFDFQILQDNGDHALLNQKRSLNLSR